MVAERAGATHILQRRKNNATRALDNGVGNRKRVANTSSVIMTNIDWTFEGLFAVALPTTLCVSDEYNECDVTDVQRNGANNVGNAKSFFVVPTRPQHGESIDAYVTWRSLQ